MKVETVNKVIAAIDKINDIAGNIAKFLLVYMAVTLSYEVIARKLFNAPTIWVFDLSKQALGFMGALGGGYTLMFNSHVKVDVIYTLLSIKAKAIIDIITAVLFYVFMIIFIWKSTEMAITSWENNEHAVTVLAPPLYYLKAAIPFGGVLVLLQGTAKFLRDILTLVTKEEQEYPSIDY